jgi:RNA polymerase sigma-70 factor (ECF subfamily)
MTTRLVDRGSDASDATSDLASAARAVPAAHLPATAGGNDRRGEPDSWLIAAVCGDPPDVLALDALVERHWAGLAGRCRLLTADTESAADLAQEAWYRLLRARHALDATGNFPAYLATIAANLWRDQNRTARRAGPLAAQRLSSLDAELPSMSGECVALADVLPDPTTLDAEAQAQLRIDVDRALAQLSPRARDVVIARFIDGETCAEIGQRYDRTEQTISAWLRRAVQDMQAHLGTLPPGATNTEAR